MCDADNILSGFIDSIGVGAGFYIGYDETSARLCFPADVGPGRKKALQLISPYKLLDPYDVPSLQ